MFYHLYKFIFLFLMIVFISYIVGLTFVEMMEARMKEHFIPAPSHSRIESHGVIESPPPQPFKVAPPELSGKNPKPEFQEWFIEKKKVRVCYKNHNHTTCEYGVTNYADPYDMGEFDYEIFHKKYPSNMTLQDYINWLYTYLDREDKLPYHHLKNLEKLKRDIPLQQEDGVLPPPPTTDMINIYDGDISCLTKRIEPKKQMLGYNYGEYSDFIKK